MILYSAFFPRWRSRAPFCDQISAFVVLPPVPKRLLDHMQLVNDATVKGDPGYGTPTLIALMTLLAAYGNGTNRINRVVFMF